MEKFNFKKKFGQNFLQNTQIINKILESADIDKETLVIEIGPGGGALTTKLCEKAGFVIAYEIDVDLKGTLAEKLLPYKNYQIIWNDFLKENIKETLDNYNYKKVKVVANLPYYITTPIINKIIDEKIEVEDILVMVQKEVGERFCALPGSREYGSITVFLNYYYNITKEIDVNRNNFYPKPNVDSVVIKLSKKERIPVSEEIFFRLVKESFQFKRKNIRNNLKNYDLELIEEVLKKYNLDLTVRAEALPVDVFIDIANRLSN